MKLFILAGHRNMEGERAFVQELKTLKGKEALLKDNPKIAYKYNLGGAYKVSNGWEPIGLTGYYDTFGPELSFAQTIATKDSGNIAIAKFTHSGSQIIDWTPNGSMAKSRHLYPKFIQFVEDSISELSAKGQTVKVAGIFYHVGENDMSFHSYRKEAAVWLKSIVNQSRKDLRLPKLNWYVSQQPPTNEKRLNELNVIADIAKVAAADPNLTHLKTLNLPPQKKMLVINTAGIVRLGEAIAKGYLDNN